MKRFRFRIPGDDGRPMDFPPEGPFWITGHGEDHVTVVAYATDHNSLMAPKNWPDAFDVDDQGEQEILFTSRFQKPDWWDDKRPDA